jgi:hypothetical protein
MKLSRQIVATALTWWVLTPTVFGQQTTGSAASTATASPSISSVSPTTSPSPTTAPTSGSVSTSNPGPATANNSPGNPSAGSNTAVNPTSPSAQAAGHPAMTGAQPGQTGSMESQRLNTLNQAYQDQQQRELSNEQQRLGAQGQPSDLNELAPSAGLPSTGAVPAFGTSRPLASAPAGAVSITNSTANRNLIVDDLRQHGLAADAWRVVNQSGRWWFWSPENTWLYLDSGRWVAYRPENMDLHASPDRDSVSFPPGYAAEDWRRVFHHGRWWFWTPNNTWMYFRDGHWNDFPQVATASDRGASSDYGVGYRGPNSATGSFAGRSSASTQPQPALPASPNAVVPNPTTNPTETQDETGMNADAQN